VGRVQPRRKATKKEKRKKGKKRKRVKETIQG
jgi:hypothetical protein